MVAKIFARGPCSYICQKLNKEMGKLGMEYIIIWNSVLKFKYLC